MDGDKILASMAIAPVIDEDRRELKSKIKKDILKNNEIKKEEDVEVEE